jgi:A/G-specific adenine glycosylase
MPPILNILGPRTLPRAQTGLLGWYGENKRQLPWRETRDPYRIWVSEMMLQQTRVAAVLDYYRRFLDRFPDVRALAKADETDVLAAWSGLGYYRRARAMHAAARKVTHDHDGVFPQTAKELEVLPGIGRYTAAAIASIAFGEPTAVVDGNVERVLSRLIGEDLRDRRETWGYAERFLQREHAGDWNQAVMELGATTCLPVEPKCLICPLRKWCADPGRAAKKSGEVRQKKEVVFSLAKRKDSVYLVQRRATDKLMASMWELPTCINRKQAKVVQRARHSITNSDYRVLVVEARSGDMSDGTWVARSRLSTLPVTGLTRKILRAANLWPVE